MNSAFNMNMFDEDDTMFSNLIFCHPTIFFNNANMVELLSKNMADGYIPIRIITDTEHALFKEIDKTKPDDIKVINAIVISVIYKDNYQA